jgi:serine/threonine protein kinase
MEEMFIAIILRGVIEALAYLHEKEKIHRDIKGTPQKLEKNSKIYSSR